jgi:hypothetical protein
LLSCPVSSWPYSRAAAGLQNLRSPCHTAFITVLSVPADTGGRGLSCSSIPSRSPMPLPCWVDPPKYALEFLEPLAADMVHVDPARRPTIINVVLRCEKLRRSLPTSHLRFQTQYGSGRMSPSPPSETIIEDSHSHSRGIAPVPARTAVLPQPQQNDSTYSFLRARRISIQLQIDLPPVAYTLAPLHKTDDSSRMPRSETLQRVRQRRKGRFLPIHHPLWRDTGRTHRRTRIDHYHPSASVA